MGKCHTCRFLTPKAVCVIWDKKMSMANPDAGSDCKYWEPMKPGLGQGVLCVAIICALQVLLWALDICT